MDNWFICKKRVNKLNLMVKDFYLGVLEIGNRRNWKKLLI